MTNKTISINPTLFSIGGSKTKKNREKKTKTNVVPLITPNVLKNKLLKRIKEHKQKEIQNLEIDKSKIKNANTGKNIDKQIIDFNDEFTDSINYLQTLSKQKNVDLERQKRKEELERKTVKNYHSMENNNLIVNIDLPEDLVQPIIQIPKTEPMIMNTYKTNDVPYGILKGGIKPSYREWSKTIKNNIVTNPNSSLIIQGGTGISSEKTVRENRLNLLKQKIKAKNEEIKSDPIISENLIKKPISDNIINSTSNELINNNQLNNTSINNTITNNQLNNIITSNNEVNGGKLIATKHITKKTIKRKYTLGKSQIKKTVSVLIKDRNTRKKILTAHKDLKRKNINDIKVYLREHNLIKTGSNAPNDVLRKLYESAMLTGEVTNSNADTLLYNFSKEEKNL